MSLRTRANLSAFVSNELRLGTETSQSIRLAPCECTPERDGLTRAWTAGLRRRRLMQAASRLDRHMVSLARYWLASLRESNELSHGQAWSDMVSHGPTRLGRKAPRIAQDRSTRMGAMNGRCAIEKP
jgi:hypothetical protein